jgi:hypothetical protein
MAFVHGRTIDKTNLLRYNGSMNQVMGAREITYRGGKQDGVKAIEVYNDTGFRFTVLVDKGMDIGPASFCGKSLAWECKNGIVAPHYFENGGTGFLRSFGGGLLTTCGLTQVGDPCEEDGTVLGIHDRINHTPAERYSVEELWENENYYIFIKGSVRQSCLYQENLLFTREITCKMGEAKIFVTDTVVNEGFNETPFMFMYHINFGYPIISEKTKLYSPANQISAWNESARMGSGQPCEFQMPTPDYSYECFTHDMPGQGNPVTVALVNPDLQIGAYLKYNPIELPSFNTWKMMGEQDYVMALEPGINIPEGRVSARAAGRLQTLKPDEIFICSYEIGVLSNQVEIDSIISSI